MSVSVPIRTDRDVQAAVQAELEWTPEVNAAGIGVAVDDGVVMLSGEIDSYAERNAVVRAAQRVRDVHAVVDELDVRLNTESSVSEADIGKEVEHALRSAVDVPGTVKAEIDGHAVILTGEVGWDFQRRAAMRAVAHLRGVYSATNRIALTPRGSAPDTEARIRSATLRNAQIDAEKVHVVVADDRVTLSGTVRSWAKRRQADLAAWSSPHVSEVYNHIVVKG